MEILNMLNEDLFDNPKDKTIILLKRKIEDFKKYDAERKQYYANSLQELGALKSYVEELEDIIAKENSSIYKKYVALKEEVRHLNKAIRTRNIQVPDDKDMDYRLTKAKEMDQAKSIKLLKEENKILRDTIDSLITENMKLKNEN